MKIMSVKSGNRLIHSHQVNGKMEKLYRLDLGCGQNKQAGFLGVDIIKAPGVDKIVDLLRFPWPFKSDSVEEVFCSHFFEHIPGMLRPKFMDELYRVMKPEAKATIVCPYYASMRSIQDYTHAWPPVCEASFLYFNKGWRVQNKLDHYDVHCDFDFSYGYAMQPDWASRNEETRGFGVRHYLGVVNDIQVVLTKRCASPIRDGTRGTLRATR